MTYFDQLTISLMFFGLICQVVLAKIWPIYKSKIKFWLGFGIILICQITVIYGSFIEPNWLEVTTEKVMLTQNPSISLKVIFVSDIHVGPYKKADFVQKIVGLVNKQNPDLVLLGGDFIYSYPEQADELRPLQKVQAKYGVYGVLGNHDYGLTRNNVVDKISAGALAKSHFVSQKLTEFEVKLLHNEITEIHIDDKIIKLVGLEDLWGDLDNYQPILSQLNTEETIILLEHNPDIILDPLSQKADLILSGHTHGGQIRLPIVGAVAGIPTEIPEKYAFGLFRLTDQNQIFISKGVGEMGPRARLFCRPEIAVINIQF